MPTGGSTEAAYNHKAILYFRPSVKTGEGTYEKADVEIFAFPVNAGSYTWRDNGYTYNAKCVLAYYTVNADGVITANEVPYKSESFTFEYGKTDCAQYYGDVIRRGIIANGYLYLVGNMNIEKYTLGDNYIPAGSPGQRLKIGEVK